MAADGLRTFPATPIPRRAATTPASASLRWYTGMPRASAAATSTFVRGTAVEITTASHPSGTFSAR